MGTSSSPAAPHVRALDGLRGAAILSVMAYHYLGANEFPDATRSSLARKIIGLGGGLWSGVDLFFVLSGFLITGILLRDRDAPGYFTRFYVRRALRIFPLYYAALFFLFVVLPRLVPFDTPGVRRIEATQGWLWAYAENFAMHHYREDFFNVDFLWVGHFWSLAVEEHFYLVWPLVVFACAPRTLRVVALVTLAATPLLRIAMLAGGAWHGSVFVLSFARLDELVMGGLLAMLVEDGWSHARLAKGTALGALLGASYLGAVVVARRRPLDWDDALVLGPGFTAFALVFAAAIVFAMAPRRTLFRRALEHPGLTTFGKDSYGAYVLHTPLQPLFQRLFHPAKIAAAVRWLGPNLAPAIGVVGFAAGGIAIVMGLAFASYHGFERHFLALKRRFEPRPLEVTGGA